MPSSDLLDVIDENGKIIGVDTRGNVHAKGLRHMETHVWFVTPRGTMIFQHRAKDKDSYPDLLDATVGGHVDHGMSYEDTAVKEMFEETGIMTTVDRLKLLKRVTISVTDKDTGSMNNALTHEYAYLYDGDITALKVEEGKAIGFEEWPIDRIFNLTNEEKKRFIPMIYSQEFLDIFKELKEIVKR